MKAVSLFSGAGGFEIGFGRAGIETVLQCEIDPWCLSVLERHYPATERITDVRSLGRETLHSVLSRQATERVSQGTERTDGSPLLVQALRERASASEPDQVQQPRTATSGEPEEEVWTDTAGICRNDDGAGWSMRDLRDANASAQGRSRPHNGASAGFALPSLQHQARCDRATGFRREGDALSRVALNGHGTDAGRWQRQSSQPRQAQRIGQGSIDLVYGGFPCQDVSVAGKRAGLSGERSGLWHEFRRILSELRPRWIIAENVPGLLSSNRGRDFLRILMDLDELGYGVAWRIVDGRFFGVPQRRRRVFIVGCLGDAHRAAQVLAVCESCGGHSQTRPETGERVAYALASSARGTGDGHGNVWNSDYIVGSGLDDEAMRPLTERSTGYRMDAESENFVVGTLRGGSLGGASHSKPSGTDKGPFVVAGAQSASDGHHGHSSPRGDGGDNLIAFQSCESFSSGHNLGIAPTLRVATSTGAPSSPAISGQMGVRRLTPLECERLMGWPDDWTRWTADGREIPDSHRYRMCGNGVIATVAEWLGHRLMRANSFMEVAA